MVITAYVTVNLVQDRPNKVGEPVMLRGDNMSAMTWVNQCRGTRDPTAAFLMRLLGVVELSAGWFCEAAHIQRIENVIADGTSRATTSN